MGTFSISGLLVVSQAPPWLEMENVPINDA
jgi:hypothetical protein